MGNVTIGVIVLVIIIHLVYVNVFQDMVDPRVNLYVQLIVVIPVMDMVYVPVVVHVRVRVDIWDHDVLNVHPLVHVLDMVSVLIGGVHV